jgi:hypothetical protein
LKKRSKKLLILVGFGDWVATAPGKSKFFCFFLFTKRSSCLLGANDIFALYELVQINLWVVVGPA